MRALVLCLIVAAASTAHAERRVSIGHHVRPCERADSWDGVVACLKHQTLGRGQVVRALTGVRVVRIERLANGEWVDNGIAVYVESGRQWRFAGEHKHFGGEYVLLALEPFASDAIKGHRLDIGVTSPMAEEGLFRAKVSMYCRSDGACQTIVPLCEVLIRGKALFVFHGTTKLEGGMIHLVGDRSRTGTLCRSPEQTPL